MAIRLSGLTSGLDTDAIVQELVSAYSLKTEKYEKAQTKLTWKQDAWKGLNTKIYSLYTNVSNLRYSSAYSLRKTTVSDNTKATVTATSDAVTGTQRLNILQTAQASYITGGKLGNDVTSSTKMSELGYKGGDTSFEVVSNDGTAHKIKITKTTTVNEVIAQLKEAGVNASFDENNKRIFVSAKESGKTNDFNLYGTDADGNNALSLLGLNTALTTTDANGNVTGFTAAGAAKYQDGYNLYMKAASAGMSVKEYIDSQIEAYNKLKEDYNTLNEKAKDYEAQISEYDALVARRDARAAYETINNAVRNAGITSDKVSADQIRRLSIEFSGKDVTTDDITALDASIAEEDAQKLAEILNSGDYDAQMAQVAAYKGGGLLTKSAAQLTQEIEAYGIEEIRTNLEDVQTQMSELSDTIKAHPYAEMVEGADTEEELGAEIQKLVDQAEEAYEVYTSPASTTGGAVKITGQDAIIKLNGVEFTSSSNSFSINGLTINAQAVTGDGDENAISITTNVDTQGIYDKIKDFLTEYNNVINEMTKLYNADSARDYEPLTDEEKEAMSEEQIEKWENKIKDSLLRRDGTLNGVMTAMINSMATAYEINGEKVSLSTFGISTMGYLNAAENENYAYHIDGDEDDENTSGKEDKLMKAIEENPDQILEFMKQLTSGLYTSIDEKMKSTELSSAYKVYNDKEMDNQLADYAEIIKKWEEKVSDKEEYYYDKFSQMEVALSKLQNSTSSISGLLGQ